MKKRWLDIPSLSQGNSNNPNSNKWCGRTSASMVYNYYKLMEGHQELFVVNSAQSGNLVYPDGTIAAPGNPPYNGQPLNAAKAGWDIKYLFPQSGRQLPITSAKIEAILQPIIDSININNPLVAYTGISTNEGNPRHIVVVSGYRKEDNGDIWLLIDDPATMRDTAAANEKSDFLGIENLQIIDAGVWLERGCRYWIKASRLFEKNQHSNASNDLWCDHKGRPGFAVWYNTSPTPDSDYSHYEETTGYSLPQLVSGVEQLIATPGDITSYYSHTEKEFPGGYFPIGGNTTWHGGLHLLGKDGDTVHAVADGVVVYARMPVKDSKQDSLEYGSRNFVLIRHGNDEQVWYSLYYHLKSVEVDSDDAKKIVWLSRDKLKFSSGSYQRQMPTKEDNIPIHTFIDGEIALILHKEKAPWYYVQRGDVNCAENRGYVYFDSARMEEVAGNAEQLDSDAVIELNFPVKAGDVIGILGEGITREDNKIVKKPILHWSIVSPQVMPGFTETVDDANDDFTCDNEKIVQLVEKSLYGEDEVFKRNGKLSSSEIEEFFKDEERAKKLRAVACKFRSEWSIMWPEQTKIFCQFGFAGKTDTLSLYNFWDDISKNENNKLPANGHVWHYNPITFLHRMLFNSARANISDDMFEADKSFLLPKKAISILSGVGKFQSGNMIKDTVLIGHKGVNGDTVDVVELSKKRVESVSAVLMLNKDRFKKFIEDNDWGDRERKIMLSWFKKADGKPYYAGSIDEDNAATLKAAVEAFQVANDLYKDGNAGKNTFAKMYELIHKMAGVKEFDKVEVLAAGEKHAGAKWKPSGCVVEAQFWTSVMAPSIEEYESDAERTYKEWAACVREEIAQCKPGKVSSGIHYGGYELKNGDNDKKKKWGGETHEGEGSFVEELQKDLLRLGYWVSNPASNLGKGMLCDGDFGVSTERALKTFQFEHFVLDEQGNIDASKKSKITGVLTAEVANKIKVKVSLIGTKAWDRPGHKPFATWQQPAGTGAYTPNKTYNPSDVLYYQLPPSEGYYRVEPEDGTRAVKHRGSKWRCTPFKVFEDDDADWMMADCWGTMSQIEMLKSIGDSWLKKADETPRTVANAAGVQEQVKPFAVRDISGFNGGPMHSHNTHQRGTGTDLARDPSNNPMCNTPHFTSVYHRNETYELCQMLVAEGAKRVLFNCHFIIKNIERAQQLSGHSDHIHVDGQDHDGNGPMLNGRYTSCNGCGIYGSCEEKIYKIFHDDEWVDYNMNNVYIDGVARGPGAVKLLSGSNQSACKTEAEWLLSGE